MMTKAGAAMIGADRPARATGAATTIAGVMTIGAGVVVGTMTGAGVAMTIAAGVATMTGAGAGVAMTTGHADGLTATATRRTPKGKKSRFDADRRAKVAAWVAALEDLTDAEWDDLVAWWWQFQNSGRSTGDYP